MTKIIDDKPFEERASFKQLMQAGVDEFISRVTGNSHPKYLQLWSTIFDEVLPMELCGVEFLPMADLSTKQQIQLIRGSGMERAKRALEETLFSRYHEFDDHRVWNELDVVAREVVSAGLQMELLCLGIDQNVFDQYVQWRSREDHSPAECEDKFKRCVLGTDPLPAESRETVATTIN